MKIRNILSVLFVGLLFTSCNSEEEVQRGNEDGRDISFSMTLTLGEVTAMTKAGGDIAEGYTYSTEDEVKVNNVVVAIFNEANGTVGECLEYKSVAFDGGIPNSTVTIDGKTLIAYKIDNIQAKTGKVRIVAIANSTHYEDLARLGTTTYENLLAKSLVLSARAGPAHRTCLHHRKRRPLLPAVAEHRQQLYHHQGGYEYCAGDAGTL